MHVTLSADLEDVNYNIATGGSPLISPHAWILSISVCTDAPIFHTRRPAPAGQHNKCGLLESLFLPTLSVSTESTAILLSPYQQNLKQFYSVLINRICSNSTLPLSTESTAILLSPYQQNLKKFYSLLINRIYSSSTLPLLTESKTILLSPYQQNLKQFYSLLINRI